MVLEYCVNLCIADGGQSSQCVVLEYCVNNCIADGQSSQWLLNIVLTFELLTFVSPSQWFLNIVLAFALLMVVHPVSGS